MKHRDREYSEVALPISRYLQLQYPKVIYHFDMAGSNLSKAQAGKMKAIQYPGIKYPDLFILLPCSWYDREDECTHFASGLFLELKTKEWRQKNGKVKATAHTKTQAVTHHLLRDAGYECHFACGFDEAKDLIDKYIKGELNE